jgi:putative acetyltransferase
VAALRAIRVPGTDDHDAIYAVTAAAFGRSDEAELVNRLRADGDAVLELVSVGDAVCGHILFSVLSVEPATIRLVGLAPVSVSPDTQGSGIGSALIREGLVRCKAMGFDAVAVLGEPAYYRRFGFRRSIARVLDCAYSGPAYQALELRDSALTGGPWRVRYASAFG